MSHPFSALVACLVVGSGSLAAAPPPLAVTFSPSLMPAQHFTVAAGWESPAKKGGPGAILVRFDRKDLDININETPAPRLKFARTTPLVAPPWKGSGETPDLENPKYLDLSEPIRFPATIAAGATSGLTTVKTSVSYFYCSKRENWCRKGTSEFEVPVLVP